MANRERDLSKENSNRKDPNFKFRLEGITNPGYDDDVDDGILFNVADSNPGKHI